VIKYTARPHAVDRAVLRFGISSEYAENWFNQLMMNAKLVGKQGGQEIYDHKGKRIVVQGTEVVTVIKAADLPFAGKISALVEKELKKARRLLAKKERELSIEIAELTVEQANINLNLLKAKSTSIRSKISGKLEIVNSKIRELTLELEREKDNVKHMEINAQGYLVDGSGFE
jgi:hypothetical protein